MEERIPLPLPYTRPLIGLPWLLCSGVRRVFPVTETAQVELRHGRVETPAVSSTRSKARHRCSLNTKPSSGLPRSGASAGSNVTWYPLPLWLWNMASRVPKAAAPRRRHRGGDTAGDTGGVARDLPPEPCVRGLHSSSSWLDGSTLRGTRRVVSAGFSDKAGRG